VHHWRIQKKPEECPLAVSRSTVRTKGGV